MSDWFCWKGAWVSSCSTLITYRSKEKQLKEKCFCRLSCFRWLGWCLLHPKMFKIHLIATCLLMDYFWSHLSHNCNVTNHSRDIGQWLIGWWHPNSTQSPKAFTRDCPVLWRQRQQTGENLFISPLKSPPVKTKVSSGRTYTTNSMNY